MKRKLHIVLILTLSLVWLILPQAVCLGATYYVATYGDDSHTKVQAQAISTPWLTINYGVSQLEPGDTLLVREGIYRESVNIRVNGTEGNRILIKAHENEKVILEGREVLTGWIPCSSQGDALGNPHWQNIYYTYISSNSIPNINEVVLFEDGVYLRYAQDPDQSDPERLEVLEFRPLEEESFGLYDGIIDSDFLNQPDDYWNGAWILIWSHAYNNAIIKRTIADYVQSEHKIYFDTPMEHPISRGTHPDAYMIYNHPLILDKPGEYYHTITPDENGNYKIYLWPRDVNDLENNIRIVYHAAAFYINYGYGSYVTIDGFEVVGYAGAGTRAGGFICPYGFVHSGLIIRNNTVHDISGYAGISVLSGSDDIIDNNYVYNIKDGRGIQTSSRNVIVRNNTVRNTKSTCIYFSGVKNGMMLYNNVSITGNHGNGLTTYQGCYNILVAGNIVRDTGCNYTMSTSTNITLLNNIFDGADRGGYLIANWGGMGGTVAILNNAILNSSNNASIYMNPRDNIHVVIKNNILDGGGAKNAERSHNIYTGLSWSQTPQNGWYPEGSEIIADGSGDYDIYDIFVNPDNQDYRLKENSIAIDAGIDISDVISTLGLRTNFSDFNFYTDLDGNPRPYGLAWDIGAYEYTLLPRVVISAKPKKGYLPLKVSFSISELITPSGKIVKWEWDFGDGTTSHEKEPSHAYTSPGEYTATLIVTDIEKYQGRAQTHITVFEKGLGKIRADCYNNVFNPTKGEKALIWIELPNQAHVKVDLYNTRGNKIRELADGEEYTGPHKYHWDGKNDSGNTVGSGLYFVHIQAGDYKKTKKIVVVK